MRTGALTAGVVLFFLCSMIFTNFGFYSGAGSLSVLIDVNEGKDANDDTFSFNMLATSPSLGMLEKEGSYTIKVIPSSVDYSGGAIEAAKGSFTLNDEGRGAVSIPYSDLFTMNGNYVVTVEVGSQKDTDSVFLNKFAESSEISMVLFDGSEPIDKDDDLVTNLFFFSEVMSQDEGSDRSITVVPSASGTITIYHSEEVFAKDKEEDYWDTDGSRTPEAVEIIDFIYSGDTLKLTYDSNNYEDGASFNPIIFDIEEFYDVRGSGDYSFTIEFSNDLGNDNSVKNGQSNWKWFHICEVKNNGECDGNK
tara:strand:- start:147 stop:1067 length:921 start_codon:yes stop_codon:yes gene_type:complete